MFWIFSGLIVWVPPLVGLGALLHSFFVDDKPKTSNGISLGMFGLFGISSILFLASIANFFVPLQIWFQLSCAIGGYSGLLLFRQGIAKALSIKVVCASILILVLLGCTTYFQEPVYDAGLYHVPITQWSLQSALPLGLANLNPFIGYNSLWPLLGAVTPIFLTETLVLFFFFLALFESANETSNGKNSAALNYGPLIGVACVLTGLESGAGSNSTDVPMAVYLIASTLLFLQRRYIPTVLTAVCALAIKLSALPFVFLLVLVCFFQAEKAARKQMAYLVLVGGGAWLLRGWMISGCLAFPEGLSCTWSVPWSVSPQMALEKVLDIKVTAGNCLVRAQGEWQNCLLKDWLPAALNNRVLQLCVFGLAVAALAFAVGCLFRRPKKGSKQPDDTKKLVLLLSLHSIGALFWFVSAPTPRFGLPYLISLGVLAPVFVFSYFGLGRIRISHAGFLFAALAVLSAKRLYDKQQAADFSAASWPRLYQHEVRQDPLSPKYPISVPIDDYRCDFARQPCRVPGAYGLEISSFAGRTAFIRTAPQN